MKKTICVGLILLVIFISSIAIYRIKNREVHTDLEKVTVAEVAHSVFYAPQYVAHSLGYFKNNGLDVNIVLASGADNVMAALLSGDADIGLSGSEATIYVYNGGNKDYVMTFAGLTQKDGSFLISRKKYDNFSLDMLKGKTVIGGRVGGMPEMTFEWVLRENGIDPKNDLNIDTSIAFAAMEGTFLSGVGDFVTLFEPNATNVLKNGYGYLVAYVGELGGNIPYTAYSTRKSYIDKNPEVIEKFSDAVNKGLKYVYEHDSSEIAKIMLEYFPDSTLEDMTLIVDRYKNGGAWKKDISINEDEWEHIQDIMMAAGELESYVSYDDLIYSDYFK